VSPGRRVTRDASRVSGAIVSKRVIVKTSVAVSLPGRILYVQVAAADDARVVVVEVGPDHPPDGKYYADFVWAVLEGRETSRRRFLPNLFSIK
jgi:hypothetical protein